MANGKSQMADGKQRTTSSLPLINADIRRSKKRDSWRLK
jgi:hypothetical protein